MKANEVGQLERRAEKIAGTLKSLGHDGRLLVLCELVRHGEVTAGSLTGIGGLSQSALSQHLSRMRDEGLVTYRREGQTLWYRIADHRIEQLMAELYRLYCGPQP
jgi:ArsR family transcriptional regulator